MNKYQNKTKYLVLTTQRTGSTWLIDLLNHQYSVEGHEELFYGKRRIAPALAGSDQYPRFIEIEGNNGILRPIKVFKYLNGLYSRPGTVGFKLMYSQLKAYPEILAYLTFRPLRIVHLIRKNHLDVIISLQAANLTGRFHVPANEKKGENFSFKIETKNLIESINRLQKNIDTARNLLRFIPSPSIEVFYENLNENEIEFRKICDFLKINKEGLVLQSNLKKRIDKRQSQVIENYSEVERVLMNTPFENLLRG